jgi:regulator of chromosome condensation
MSSVDRKRGRDWDDDDEGDDSTAVVQSRRRLPFMLRKRAIYNQNLTKVNQWMNRLIQKYLALIGEPLPRNVKPSEERIEDLDHTTMLFQEYLRIQKEIEDLYNRPAGDVVFMGSNEFSLFRLKDETEETESEDADADDDDDVKEYPPTIHKRLPSGKFIQVAVGGMHTAALTADGQVYTWGDEQNGALARESNAADWVVTGFRNRGTCYDDEENEDGQIVAIQAGESFTTFQTINGNVYTSGMYKCDNLIFHDVLWDPSNPVDPKGPNKEPIHILMDQKVRLIAAGGNMNAALFADGCTLVTWGTC